MKLKSDLKLSEGDRVRAVWFTLDTGLRIWPDQTDPNCATWRVVQVSEHSFAELFRGDQQECLARYPDATYGVNDNESVPPGTLGTVETVHRINSFVRWDNGRRLGLTPNDEVEIVAGDDPDGVAAERGQRPHYDNEGYEIE